MKAVINMEETNRIDELEPDLTPCPCGSVAVWYRIVLYVQGGNVMRATDFYDDLCDDCFRNTVADEDRNGWLLHSTAKDSKFTSE